ncbi:MAG: hypothetical protein AAF500_01710 [Myxococcota bacterium]
MGSVLVRISEELVDFARTTAVTEFRSVSKQIEYWARIGRELDRRCRAAGPADPLSLLAPSERLPSVDPAANLSEPRAWTELPEADLIAKGVRDKARGERTAEALLIELGRSGLDRMGVKVPGPPWPQAHDHLYGLLQERHPDTAHKQYVALVERLASFLAAVARPAEASRAVSRSRGPMSATEG